MSRIELRLRTAPTLRVDLRGLRPEALADLGEREISQWPLWHGRERVTLGEFFTVTRRAEDVTVLHIDGDCSRFDALGSGMTSGELQVDGAVGDYVGAGMSGGMLRVAGAAGLFAGCEMSGGRLEVGGDAGDFVAGARPGSMDGMRGGELVVRGSAGARLADRMRRGTVWVHGDAGEFAASRMVAGTLAIGGRVGAHLAFGMRRGTVVLCQAQPAPCDTFVSTCHDFGAAWALLRRSLVGAGGTFAALPTALPQRRAGDLAVDGRGELLISAAATA